MRLLNSKTLELVEFMENEVPPYAILSHTWEKGEVSFQDMHGGAAKARKGYEKLQRCCQIATSSGFEYAWVDTCCIDKSSSSELSEAINSMYSWYQKAEVCYVYLSDYHSGASLGHPDPSFKDSNHWQDIGSKHSLKATISEITKIQVEVLLDGDNIGSFSVAQRMCWASRRQTTRIEDIAYCVMGIFGVHILMLYEKGQHAFIRLQEEIIKKSVDHTIFAWQISPMQHSDNLARPYSSYFLGLLATSPAAFAQTATVVQVPLGNTMPFEMTNKGMHLHLPLFEVPTQPWSNLYYAILDCREISRPSDLLCIRLEKTSESSGWDIFRPVMLNEPPRVAKVAQREGIRLRSVYIAQYPRYVDLPLTGLPRYDQILIETNFTNNGIAIQEVYPHDSSQKIGLICFTSRCLYFIICGALRFGDASGNGFIVGIKEVTTKRFEADEYTLDSIPAFEVALMSSSQPSTGVALLQEDIRRFKWGDPTQGSFLPDRVYWQHPVTKVVDFCGAATYNCF